jgi:L-ascorbate metabolism protein UlaG (beta-lactamase superfamily)
LRRSTHNHFDHVNDIPIIAQNTKATVVSIVETAEDLSSKGCEKIIGCNIGGVVKLKGLELIFTQAFHSMSSNPSGVIIFYNNKTIYHAGDTGVFSDMELIGEMYPIDLALLPIGGHFTMGLKEAQKAIQLLKPKKVVPIHYNTFDLIKQDVDENLVKKSDTQLLILKPGEEIIL